MSFATAGAIVGIGSAAYSVYNSVRKNAAAKRLAKENIRPVFNADGSIREVYDLARNDLDNTYTEDYARRQLDQNTMSGIDAVLKSGGRLDFETAHNRYGGQLQAQLNQIMLARDRKIANLNNAAYNQAASQDTEFQYNLDAPYKDRQQLQAQLMQEGAASARDAVTGVASTVSNYAIMKQLDENRNNNDWQGPTERIPYANVTPVTAASLRQPSNVVIGGRAPVISRTQQPAVQWHAPMLYPSPIQDQMPKVVNRLWL